MALYGDLMGSMGQDIVVVGFNIVETVIQGRMSQTPLFSDRWCF